MNKCQSRLYMFRPQEFCCKIRSHLLIGSVCWLEVLEWAAFVSRVSYTERSEMRSLKMHF